MYVEGAGVQECAAVVTFSVEVRGAGELGACPSDWQSGGGDTGGDGTGGRGVFGTAGGGGSATNCVSCCSCVVRATRVELMLLSETFFLSVSS